MCVFVLAEHTDRGVPYGSRIEVQRGLRQWCSPLNKCVSWSFPLTPGWETGVADGNKGLLVLLAGTSISQQIWKGKSDDLLQRGGVRLMGL